MGACMCALGALTLLANSKDIKDKLFSTKFMATGSWVAKDAGHSLSQGLSPTAFNPASPFLQSIIAASVLPKK